jgi:hypothetical protein
MDMSSVAVGGKVVSFEHAQKLSAAEPVARNARTAWEVDLRSILCLLEES